MPHAANSQINKMMKCLIPILLLLQLMLAFSCDKEYRCNCTQVVGTLDTTFTLTGEGRNAQVTCDAFDSEETTFGVTKTVDCEPF
jgi:hypothetical protein